MAHEPASTNNCIIPLSVCMYINNQYNIVFENEFEKLPIFNKENVCNSYKEHVKESSIKNGRKTFINDLSKSIKDLYCRALDNAC